MQQHEISLCTHGFDRSSQSIFKLQEGHLLPLELKSISDFSEQGLRPLADFFHHLGRKFSQ